MRQPQIFVTQPLAPEASKVGARMQGILSRHQFTNFGPLHNELESELAARIAVGHFSLWNNGTNALMGALSQLDLSGQVIVTPFTFPATVQTIAMLGLEPVFADIDPETLTLSPESARDRTSAKTSAVIGTHIYGTQCDTDALWQLRDETGMRVIYDGAHSLGQEQPYFNTREGVLGDVTMLSFHATKLLHTVEGGGLLTYDSELHRRFVRARNFGFEAEDAPSGLALNGKLSEVHAAIGLEVLPLVEHEIECRSSLAREYSNLLSEMPGLKIQSGLGASKQYFVVRIKETEFGASRDDVWSDLRAHGYMARRYFYPLCSDIPGFTEFPFASDLPVARAAVQECLALPFYGRLDRSHLQSVAEIIAARHRT